MIVANTAAAKKYYRASQRRRLQNKPVRTRARTAVRDALTAIQDADWAVADGAVTVAVAALDRASQKGVIHANNAAAGSPASSATITRPHPREVLSADGAAARAGAGQRVAGHPPSHRRPFSARPPARFPVSPARLSPAWRGSIEA